MTKVNTQEIRRTLCRYANDKYKEVFTRFFKTGPGEYGEGDAFLGIRVPQIRNVVRQYSQAPAEAIEDLVHSPWHEERLCGFLILVDQFRKEVKKEKGALSEAADRLFRFYLDNTVWCDNWDIVDVTCPHVIGEWLVMEGPTEEEKLGLLDRLACSESLWEQRMAMVSTITPLKHGQPGYTLRNAEHFLSHPHDLMHKATGWMLREMGKNVSMDLLRAFLERHYSKMPRTMLRYAIEKMDEQERQYWLNRKNHR